MGENLESVRNKNLNKGSHGHTSFILFSQHELLFGINLDLLKICGKDSFYVVSVSMVAVITWFIRNAVSLRDLAPGSKFKCARCLGTARAIDRRQPT